MQEKNVKFIALGCRLNAVEAEKIRKTLEAAGMTDAVLINTCAVTAEAERQSRQTVRKLVRESPNTPIFITGCAVTRAFDEFSAIPGVTRAVPNADKMKLSAYLPNMPEPAPVVLSSFQTLSKGFVQIQNGCNHSCAYCIVSSLRGKNVSIPYAMILDQVRALVQNGYAEIVLTGVDIAGYLISPQQKGGVTDAEVGKGPFRIADLCAALLRDVPGMRRLRLSSMDPATDLRPLINLMATDARMLPHLHLSMQSGSDAILGRMGRRHSADIVRGWVRYAHRHLPAGRAQPVTFSWDIICGFPGETLELFDETCVLIRELKPIRLHAFPFSPRPGTVAAKMDGMVSRAESKKRVKIVTGLAYENRDAFMKSRVGTVVSVLTEENNIARDPDDIAVNIAGRDVPARWVVDVRLDAIAAGDEPTFVGTLVK